MGAFGIPGFGTSDIPGGSSSGGGFLDFLNSSTFKNLIGLGTGITGLVLSNNAANNASDAMANAANNAALLQANSANDALRFGQQVYADQQHNLAPFLASGTSAQVNLARLLGVLPKDRAATAGTPGTPGTPATPASLMHVSSQDMPNPDDGNIGGFPIGRFTADGLPTQESGVLGGPSVSDGILHIDGTPGTPGTPGVPADPGLNLSQYVNPDLGAEGSLMQGWTGKFNAPTDVTEQNDPGYAFRLAQGMKALNAGAAAKGNLLSGGTVKAGQRYAQDYASNEYGNVYNRALGEYQQGYNEFQQGQTNQYNRLASLAGLGQTTAAQLNTAGTQAAGNNSSILLNSANQIGNQLNNAGYARGSGYINANNAITGGINNISTSLKQLLGGG